MLVDPQASYLLWLFLEDMLVDAGNCDLRDACKRS